MNSRSFLPAPDRGGGLDTAHPVPPRPPVARQPRARTRRPGVGRAGFTLVELVTVVALVSLVLGITLPRIDLERARVRSSANELVTVLVSAQSRAVLNQHDVAVSFDTTAATALVHLDADNDGSVGAGETTRLVQLGEGVRFGAGPAAGSAPGGGQAVTFSQTHAGLPAVVFHRNGSASQNGVVNLVAGSDVATTFDDRYVRSIEIARPTGRAVCYRLRDGSWEASC